MGFYELTLAQILNNKNKICQFARLFLFANIFIIEIFISHMKFSNVCWSVRAFIYNHDYLECK